MLSTIKKVFTFLIILTVIGVLILFMYSNNRTYFNKEDEIGNTTGNIYNGGLFCEQDGKIYFSNDSDDGALYVMNSDCTNVKKIHDDKAVYINADDNYLYYVRANNTRVDNSGGIFIFNNTGVYRINQNGDNMKAITGNPGAYLTLKGNSLYFQRYDAGIGLYLYRYQIDGKQERLLVKDSVIPAAITNNELYYPGFSENSNLNRLDLSSYTTETSVEGSFAYPIFRNDYIYYIDIKDHYTINRMKPDGSEKTTLVDKPCSTYNITESGKYLYYQVDDKENSKICRLNLETMKSETLKKGNFKQINITEYYVFFKTFDDSTTYVQLAEGEKNLVKFDPSK